MRTKVKSCMMESVAFLLCVSLVFGILPSGNALAAGDESMVFNFGHVQNNAAGDTDITADVSDIKTITAYGNNGARKWRYLESSGVRDDGESYYDNYYTCIRTNTGGWAAFELTGLSGGEYSANVTYRAVAAPIATAELYILPAEAVSGSSIANYLASGKLPFGTVRCESGESAGFEEVQLAPSESGKYILVVSTPVQGGRVAINNITFTRQLRLTDVEISFENAFVGDKITPTVVWKSGEQVINGKKGVLSFTVAEDDGEILRQDAAGAIYAVATGSATLSVTAELAGEKVKKEAEVVVTENSALSGVNQSYLFYNGAYEDYTESPGFILPGASNGRYITEEEFLTGYKFQDYSEYRPWAMIAAQASIPSGVGGYLNSNNTYTNLCGNIGDWVAYKVKVPAAGEYTVDVSIYSYTGGGLAKLYMLPYEETMDFANVAGHIEEYTSDEYFIGEAEARGTEEAVVRKNGVGSFRASTSLDYSDGYAEYLMIVKTEKSKLGNTFAVLLGGIHLKGKSGVHLVRTDISEDVLGEGECIYINETTAYEDDNSPLDLGNAFVYYAVDAESADILSVDSETGVITALSEGVGRVVTYVAYNSGISKTENTITVDNDYSIRNAYIYGNGKATVGEEISYTVGLELENRRVIRGGEILSFEIEEESTEGVVKNGEKGTLKAGKAGTARVRAKIKARGKVLESDAVTVEVVESSISYPANFTIDMRKEIYQGDAYSSLGEITEYSAYRNWMFYEFKNPETEGRKIALAEKTGNFASIVWNLQPERYLAFKVDFAHRGEYRVDSCSSHNRWRAAKIELYIVPVTPESEANIQAQLEPDRDGYVGAVDYYSAEELFGVDASFGTKEITAPGEYFVVFKNVPGKAMELRGNEAGDAWYPLYFTFKNLSSISEAVIEGENGRTTVGISGGENALNTSLHLFDGSGTEIEYTPDSLSFLGYSSADTGIATVSEDGVITGISEGSTTITVTVIKDGVTVTGAFSVRVEDLSGVNPEIGIKLQAENNVFVYGSTQLKATIAMNSGALIVIPPEYITWELCDETVEGCAEIRDNRLVGKKVGRAIITASISREYLTAKNAETLTIDPIEVDVVWDTDINPQIFTMNDRENAQKNAERYGWARQKVKAVTEKADAYVENIDLLYEMMVPEGLPRYYHIGHSGDPAKFNCRYCGTDISIKYGSYNWEVDPIRHPWKVQCPECTRRFPSNDFGSFYSLGLSEDGDHWIYEKALRKHHELFVCADGESCACTDAPHPTEARMSPEWIEYYGFGKGYLANSAYPEMDEKLGVVGWGVDDSLGYMQPYISPERAAEIAGPGGDITKVPGYDSRFFKGGDGLAWYAQGTAQGPVKHTYIAYYLHEGVWYGAGKTQNGGVIDDAIEVLADAFVYTGEAKYGRAGAILLDRLADLYPAFDWYQWASFRGEKYRGKIIDPIWACKEATLYAQSYDAFLPIYNDASLVEYLSAHGAKYETDENGNYIYDSNGELIPVNLKDSPGALRKNIEDNLLLQFFDDAKKGKLSGNFGMHQRAVASAALALNRFPETAEMLDWIMQAGETYNTGPELAEPVSGGQVLQRLVNLVNRDGSGNENAPGYNRGWLTHMIDVADILQGYELYPQADLFRNVKFVKMFTAQLRLTLGGYYGAQIGDSGATADPGLVADIEPLLLAFKNTGDPLVARALYKLNGDSAEGLYGSILDDDPEKVKKDIESIVEQYGAFNLDSDMMTGYGFAALREGKLNDSVTAQTETNTNRDFAIYFGGTSGHGHLGVLNLYMSAFGLNFAPDLGYPEETGPQPNRHQWVRNTLSHNTVVVDEKRQDGQDEVSNPYHFDDSGRVKTMEIDGEAYLHTDDYRRSIFMVDVNDEVSYGVDFFHVKGGNDHLYSFHSQSDEIEAVSGLSDQEITPMYTDEKGNLYGTYAGANVKYGSDPGGNAPANKYPLGYTWLRNVRTFKKIEKDFTVEFKVKDFNKILPVKKDLRLRLTMVNDEPMKEVTFASALPPQDINNKNVGELEYLLVRNTGKNLDTLFTSVLEPFEKGKEYIEKIEKIPMVRLEESKPGLNDTYSAVKVYLKNGRTDYIIYSSNTNADYIVDGRIKFRGFGGVISTETIEQTETVVYSYLNDGEVLEFEGVNYGKGTAAYTGKVSAITEELSKQNFISFVPDAGQKVDLSELQGRYVYVDNDGVQNGAYKIESAKEENGEIILDIGEVSLIRSYVDAYDTTLGYIYNIACGQALRIPLSSTYDSAPVVEQPQDYTTSAGSSVSIPISANSPVGKDISVVGTTLPRGMSINEETMTLTWKPTSSQVGENHVAITVTDGTMETTVHFTVTVYGSTTSKPSQGEDNTGSTDSTETPSDGGGGGGGAAPAPDEGDNTGDGTNSDDNNTSVGEGVPALPSVGFIDLGNHTWAEAAINELAENGVIKGTSATTFSPANNITRADFAVLLVRAFELKSDNTENFADVTKSDYFASELAIARNCGIVGGIGDNKYAPRNTITRQDMMVIVYRALDAILEEFAVSNTAEKAELEGYPDFNKVAPYAQDAVRVLITAGLVNGKNGLIDPTAYTTRAEVAVLIKRILDYTAQSAVR